MTLIKNGLRSEHKPINRKFKAKLNQTSILASHIFFHLDKFAEKYELIELNKE